MRQLWKAGARCAVVSGLIGLAMLLTGCQGDHVYKPLPGTETGTGGAGQSSPVTDRADVFHVGDSLKVTLASPSTDKNNVIYEDRIKDDGTITPPDVGSVRAAGRTAGDLQKELQEKYDVLYKNMTVTVTAGDRFYYVDGEVVQRGPKAILGQTDIKNAISAAGGFTDYANRKKIKVIRLNGQVDIVNYNEILEDAGYNVRIYPGDQIVVPRRFW